MGKFLNKLNDMVFGAEDDYEEFDEQVEETIKPSKPEVKTSYTKKSDRVVNIHATTQLEVAVLQPTAYEDAREIADRLKAKKAVVVNLESMGREDASKVLDFISGVIYALEGKIQKVSNAIFLIAPYNVSITNDLKDELKKGMFPWNY